MTPAELIANKIATELREGLDKQFAGGNTRSDASVRANIIAYIQGFINQCYADEKIEFAPLPTIDVRVEGPIVQIDFYDPETKELTTLPTWLSKHAIPKWLARRKR